MVDRKKRKRGVTEGRTDEARVLLAAVSLLGASVGLMPSTPAGAYDDTAQPLKTAANKTYGTRKWNNLTLKRGIDARGNQGGSTTTTGGAVLKPSSTQGLTTTKPINPVLTGTGSALGGRAGATTTGVKPK